MNQEAEYRSIGKMVATHGLKGDLVLKHALGKKTVFKDLKALFIKDKTASYLPWFLETARIKSDTETLVKLEGINTTEQARALLQKEVWLAAADFEKYVAKNSVISFIGYTIVDNGQALGKIEEIIEQPHQIICKLVISNKEVLIPLHDETLKRIDNKSKMLLMELPDGLLDIYLQ